MDKIVRMSMIIGGILVWVVLAGFFGAVFGWTFPDWDRPIIGAGFTISDLLGLACGVITTVLLWRNETVYKYGLEIAAELRNVTWPKWPETRTSTIVVFVVAIVVAGILGLFDLVVGSLMGLIYGI
ncbi:MAG TPA: preprotein translocase subunit SecE [Myxococcota bacterium]|nr:preprotein translocase subunit SecE [Myxococcota bacterium]HNZ02774.1 preprotein translocase subunit SecE [Myxococcota bacterium]HOD08418.1 preprotein translocase subunit SecE [Myxococcota bacterium]HPB50802.1 preprotein translocase subunit SecE [Myxococcota bacterium]HQP94621.1 preprotein translocase subunit SecE [Myxococcota bacterium]